MKYIVSLLITLTAVWFVWSGHVEPFMLFLAAGSILFSLWISFRMSIVDEEGAPVEMGIRPFIQFAPWLFKEIVESNITVAKIILSRDMNLKRNYGVGKNGRRRNIGPRVIV